MSFSISRKSFAGLDTNNSGKVELSEVKKLDTNNDQIISEQEASAADIASERDVYQLNQALKFFESSEPNQVVFVSNRESQSPLDFSDAEAQGIVKRYTLHPPKEESILKKIEIADSIKPLKDLVLSNIESNRDLINQHARDNGVNPLLLASVIFEEQMHLTPPIIEDFVAEAVEDWDMGQNLSVGPGQLGVGELIKQGYYESEGIPRTAEEDVLSESQRERGQTYLRDPDNGIKTLARQIARLKSELSYGSEPLDLNSYRGQRGAALVSYIHNGYADYPSRILEYTRDTDLKTALYPPRRTFEDLIPHTL